MTPYWKVFGPFLAKTLEDEWGQWMPEETEADMRQILESAIPYFKFPRKSLDRDDRGFIEDLDSEEIQLLSCYMKCEWLNRSIMTWENVKPLYEERDFSQANLLEKLKSTLEYERTNVARLEDIYYRSIKGKSYKYSSLAGGV